MQMLVASEVQPRMTDFGDQDNEISRRDSPRVAGPFDGQWCGALSVPLRLYDLSVGGCLVASNFEATVGRRIEMEIDLQSEGVIRLHAETLYLRQDFGFGARFIDVDPETQAKLERVIRSRA